MDYVEHLMTAVEQCDIDNTEDLEQLLHFLVREAITYQYLATETDEKLKEYITVAEYEDWSEEVTEELIRKNIALSPDEDFREFCEKMLEDISIE